MAPDARLVSLKVAGADGATDVSQVIAAIDWVVQHRRDPGLNIRVLNLSYGTDGTQSYLLDPLAHAVEVAWRKGIVVVAAAGNRGSGSQRLTNPAYDPFVLAVGGADGHGTYTVDDDTIPEWSSWGDATRAPDLVAPGKSVVSLRSPGSQLDQAHPLGRVGAGFFRGSGTSQAAAAVAGAAALVLQQRPGLNPDQVKKLLTATATRLGAADGRAQGAGMLDLKQARNKPTPSAAASAQLWAPSSGTGSLEAGRGGDHLVDEGVELADERDVLGGAWDGVRRSAEVATGTTWVGGTWNGNRWSGDSWAAGGWASVPWSGDRWSGNRWSDATWSGNRWSGNRWSAEAWSGNRWSGNRWSGNRWSTAGWGG